MIPKEPSPWTGTNREARTVPMPSSLRILIVEDHCDSADNLASLLRHWGNVVDVAYDGFEALTHAKSFAPDVVLLDIGMPGIDGYEVARRLREGDSTRWATLVALTGWGE